MGKSAKLTRGGNKKRVNVGRQEAKLKAQGSQKHVPEKTAKKESDASPKQTTKKQISSALKAQTQSAVKMAAKPTKQQSSNEEEQ